MRIIPVIDLMNGHAVRAIAGRRSEYRPIGNPRAVAQWYRDTFGLRTVYVADLDAIMHAQPDVRSWHAIAQAGLQIWLDAGVGDLTGLNTVTGQLSPFASGSSIVVGLESLVGLDALAKMIEAEGSSQIIFSLDMRGGEPMTKLSDEEPVVIARHVAAMGVQRMIVLDLADVGVGGGTRTLDLCRKIRSEFPAIELTAGGGVRGIDDLKALHEVGCNAALVASALHDERLTARDVREVESWQR